jgi:hypothetical protein
MRAFIERLRADRSGVAAVEFALAIPIVLTIGLTGLELANLAIDSLRVSEVSTTIADTAGRAGASADPTVALDEADVIELFTGAKQLGLPMDFATNGRVILSDLEPRSDGSGQWIRWQRCYGMLQVGSRYGTPRSAANVIIADGSELTTPSDQTMSVPSNGSLPTPTTGMGPAGQQITASSGTAVMFVEVFYTYQPIVGNRWLGARTLHYTSAYNVRQRTDNRILNASGLSSSQKAACNRYYS